MGVRTALWGNVIAAAILLLLALVIQGGRGALQAMQLPRVLSAIEAAEGLYIIGILLWFIILAGAIMGLVGLAIVVSGRSEFGPGHERAARNGAAFLAVAGLLYLAGGAVRLIYVAGGTSAIVGAPSPSEVNAAMGALAQGTLLSTGVDLVAVACASVGMAETVARLVTSEGRGRRAPFFVLSWASGALCVLMAAMVSSLLSAPLTSMTDISQLLAWMDRLLGAMLWLALIPAISALVGAWALALYRRMLDEAGEGARRMVVSQTLDPDAGSPFARTAAGPPFA